MDSLVSEILREYQIVVDELIERDFLIDTNLLFPFISQKRTVLTWSSTAHLSYLYGEYATIKQYCSILDNRDFCLCFNDGGLVQIRYDIEDNEIARHRLCYFPCPFSFVAEDMVDFSLSEIPLYYDASDLREHFKLVTPIRFDFDAQQVDDKHAHSHFSLIKESCRVPVYGPVSIGHFFRFVFRYFYETEFVYFSEWDELKPRFYGRTLPHPPPHELHLDTAITY